MQARGSARDDTPETVWKEGHDLTACAFADMMIEVEALSGAEIETAG